MFPDSLEIRVNASCLVIVLLGLAYSCPPTLPPDSMPSEYRAFIDGSAQSEISPVSAKGKAVLSYFEVSTPIARAIRVKNSSLVMLLSGLKYLSPLVTMPYVIPFSPIFSTYDLDQ